MVGVIMSLILDKKILDKHNSSTACAEIRKNIPRDLLPFITVLLQDSGYVTISPIELTRPDWDRLNEKINRMGGIWVSGHRSGHWSIPYSSIS